MNAHPNILSQNDYTARRSQLRADLAKAKADNDRAELQAVVGDIGDDELDKARAAVSNIEGKLRGLDAAWAESQRRSNRQQAMNDALARRKAAQTVRELDARRIEEMEEIDRIISSLKTHVKAVAETERAITSTLAPHSSALRADRGYLVGEIRDKTREHNYVLGALFAAGFGDWGIGVKFAGATGDLEVLNRTKSNAVEKAARLLLNE